MPPQVEVRKSIRLEKVFFKFKIRIMNNAKRRSRRMATTYPVSTSSAWHANWARDTVETSTAAKEASEKTY